MQPSVVDIYRAVYAPPPYNETEEHVQKFASAWIETTRKAGFTFVGAEDEQGKLLGFAYGMSSVSGDKWNIRLRDLIGDDWVSDCFEFYDLCVAPEAQGLGLGSRLMGDVFKYVRSRTAVLLTSTEETRASKMYARHGWIPLYESLEVSPGHFYRIMGKRL